MVYAGNNPLVNDKSVRLSNFPIEVLRRRYYIVVASLVISHCVNITFCQSKRVKRAIFSFFLLLYLF